MPAAVQCISSISDEDKKVFKFFGSGPCLFYKCARLRAKYYAERDAAPVHMHPDIVRTYSDLVRDALGYARKFENVALSVGVTPLRITRDGASTEISGQMSVAEMEPYKFFGEGPCFFEGCEELRKQYWKEYGELEEDPKCTDCMKSGLTKVYLEKVLEVLGRE